MERFRWK